MTRSTPLLLALLATACSGTKLSADIVFPDQISAARVTGLVITAIEPFAPSVDEFARRRVVRCGQVGVFPPTSPFNRDGTDLPGVESLLVNREFHRFPLDEDWSLDIPNFKLDIDANPWRALLVHIEARGPAQAYNEGLTEPADATLLSGCFCVRLNEEAQHEDAALDEEVKANCGTLSELEGEAISVELGPVAGPEFRLEPCGVDSLTAPRGQRLGASPAVCVRTIRCGENSGGRACFKCADQACSELNDMSSVPVQVSITGGGATRPSAEVILTDEDGRAVPEVEVSDCAAPFTIEVGVVGRLSERASFQVACVPAVAFGSATQTMLDRNFQVRDVTALPPAREAGGGRGPARLAVLSFNTATLGSQVVLYERRNGAFVEAAPPIALPNETARGIHGYYYELASNPDDRDLPMLAVATSIASGVDETLKVRLYAFEGGNLVQKRESNGPCPVCACRRPAAATPCMACDCEHNFNFTTRAVITDSDIDADGFSDLSVGVTSDFPLVTYYSSVHDLAPADRRRLPPPLDSNCMCSRFGKLLTTYDLVRLGGRDPDTELFNVDFVVGDVTGAFALYALGSTIDGRPCDPGQAAGPQCGTGRRCLPLCRSGTGRCVQDCANSTPCDANRLRPTCSSTSGDALASQLCGGPMLRCDQPSSIWKLVNVRYVTKGKFNDGPFEDVLAIASSSPSPSADDRGLLRIMFGDRLDLAAIDQEAMEVRNRSSFDLVPLSFAGSSPPQGPKTAQVADFNGDGFDDAAVLYGASEEIHVWLGGGNRGPGEISEGVRLGQQGRCFPLDQFAAGDFDGDGRAEVVAVCSPMDAPALRHFTPEVQ